MCWECHHKHSWTTKILATRTKFHLRQFSFRPILAKRIRVVLSYVSIAKYIPHSHEHSTYLCCVIMCHRMDKEAVAPPPREAEEQTASPPKKLARVESTTVSLTVSSDESKRIRTRPRKKKKYVCCVCLRVCIYSCVCVCEYVFVWVRVCSSPVFIIPYICVQSRKKTSERDHIIRNQVLQPRGTVTKGQRVGNSDEQRSQTFQSMYHVHHQKQEGFHNVESRIEQVRFICRRETKGSSCGTDSIH